MNCHRSQRIFGLDTSMSVSASWSGTPEESTTLMPLYSNSLQYDVAEVPQISLDVTESQVLASINAFAAIIQASSAVVVPDDVLVAKIVTIIVNYDIFLLIQPEQVSVETYSISPGSQKQSSVPSALLVQKQLSPHLACWSASLDSWQEPAQSPVRISLHSTQLHPESVVCRWTGWRVQERSMERRRRFMVDC